VKEQLEQDLIKYQELQRVNEINAHRLDALITYIQEKLTEEQAKEEGKESKHVHGLDL
jgi:hypothetical protein